MHRMPLGRLLKRHGHAQGRTFFVEFAGEHQTLRESVDEPTWNYRLRMTCQVCRQQESAEGRRNQYIPIRHELVHLLHEQGANTMPPAPRPAPSWSARG